MSLVLSHHHAHPRCSALFLRASYLFRTGESGVAEESSSGRFETELMAGGALKLPGRAMICNKDPFPTNGRNFSWTEF